MDDDRAPTLYTAKCRKRKKETPPSEEEKRFKRIAGQMKRDRLLFCFHVIRPFLYSRAFCVCVCIVEYGTHIYTAVLFVCALLKIEK